MQASSIALNGMGSFPVPLPDSTDRVLSFNDSAGNQILNPAIDDDFLTPPTGTGGFLLNAPEPGTAGLLVSTALVFIIRGMRRRKRAA